MIKFLMPAISMVLLGACGDGARVSAADVSVEDVAKPSAVAQPVNAENPTETLFSAAFDGDLATFKAALEAGADVNAVEDDGDSLSTKLFLKASGSGYGAPKVELVAAATEAGWSVKQLLNNKETPLYVAIESNALELAEYLIANGADINHRVTGANKVTALQNAAVGKRGRAPSGDKITWLLKNGADPDVEPSEGYEYPLIVALERNYSEMAKLLIEAGANPNVQVSFSHDSWPATAAVLAETLGHVDPEIKKMMAVAAAANPAEPK